MDGSVCVCALSPKSPEASVFVFKNRHIVY